MMKMRRRIVGLMVCVGIGLLFLTIPALVAAVEVIFDGSVTLGDDTFTWTDSGNDTHVVNWMTPHGALEAASIADGFDYGGGWHGGKSTALIDWIAGYEYNDSVTPKLTWNYQLNGAFQKYFSDTTGVSNLAISDGDYIELYYGPDQETTENATAVVRIAVNPASAVDVIWDGSVILGNDTFNWTVSGNDTHVVNWMTPHGALEAASVADGFDYNGSWNGGKNTALIDWIAGYEYEYVFSHLASPSTSESC